ncbi:tetratricopeptide repeat protein [Aurantiacibacter spongiae]|uniref:Ancillary SecYEG translocon subunit/Cell division coordinator CpoB TPR domain-containing protein n=1 Tax=Aurantiacibacter spongiae TaxID=2488860 RepID=A0A3N5CPB1_9SPHN|nr:tetratricopeptide repeat protein [Aurantiacibacter spongiae]RPF70814.1 hypothetical protein EG799_03650 [Aurantiacibacter spongiae]
MALQPTPPNPPAKRDAEQDMFMREVDEAVRHDEVGNFARKYGWPLGIALVVALAAFGGWLFWQDRSEGDLEGRSEQIVQAIDELDAGNPDQADRELAALADGEGGAAVTATMLRAGIAAEAGRGEDAARMYDAVAGNGDVPEELRNVAAIRSVTARFDQLDPQEVIDRLGPLASAGNDFFGSAGELVAHAYLKQGKEDQAGPLFAQLAKDEDVPETIRFRARQMAGSLGYDAIDDVDALLEDFREQQPRGGSAQLVE